MTGSEPVRVGATDATADVRFTFEWYARFLQSIADRGFTFGTYDEPVEPGTALLRHDVDLSPRRALRMAEIERDLDITGTYFFLVSSPMYNVLNEETREVLTAIEELGHDVGLHFSTHQYWCPTEIPDDDAVAEAVADERSILETVTDPVETVSFHIPPERILRHEFEAFPSTYEPRFFTEIDYHGDSDQRWREDPPRIDRFEEKVQLLTHPGLWGETDAPFEERIHQGVDGMAARTSEYAMQRYVLQQFG